jgi:hypothetical protein
MALPFPASFLVGGLEISGLPTPVLVDTDDECLGRQLRLRHGQTRKARLHPDTAISRGPVTTTSTNFHERQDGLH